MFGNLIIVGLLPAVIAINTFGFYIMREQMRMKHFEFMAELLDAHRIADGANSDPKLEWHS